MSPLNAVVAKHSIIKFKERMTQRHKCMNFLHDKLESISYLMRPGVADGVNMGAWYGYKPLYLENKLEGIPLTYFLKAAQAEGLQISKASAPVLDTLPLVQYGGRVLFRDRREITI
jgi:hypothetical protein